MKTLINTLLIVLCSINLLSCSSGTQQELLNRRLISAVVQMDLHTAEQALQDGADVNATDESELECTAWERAAMNRDLPMVTLLVKHGAGVRAINEALGWAAVYDDLLMIKLLLDHGADVHAKNDWALTMAACNGHWAVVSCLLQHDANRMKLTSEQLEQLYNSEEAQNYVALEIHSALVHNNPQEITKLLKIIPLDYFSMLCCHMLCGHLPIELLLADDIRKLQRQIQQSFTSEISTTLQSKNLSRLQQLLNLVPFDQLPEQTQNQIREFILQRELHGARARKTKYS